MRIKDLILSLLFCCICWNVTAQRGGELEGTHNVEIYPQLGHSGTAGASNLKFSPDGKQIISVGSNVILWDVATGRILRTFPGSLATFSPDGKYIITVSHSIYDSTSEIKLWDISSGQEIRIFSGHTWRVDSVSFSPDGRQIISGSGDRTIKLWDVITGREIRTFLGHARGVDSVSFSPDGRQIVSGSIDGIIKLWDAATGREIRTFTGHSSIVNSVMFSSDGRQILSCSQDSNIKLWDANTGREIRTFSGHSLTVRTAMFTPDGRQILSSSYDGTIKIWDVATGRENRTFFEESWHAILSPDGMHILSSIGHIVTLRDISTGIEIKRFTSNATAIEAVAYNTSNKQIVTSANDKIIIWDTINGREIRNFRGPFGNMILSPDGRQILTGSKYFGRGDGSTFTNDVILYDYATGRENKYFSSEYAVGSMIWAIAFNPNSMQIASGRNSARQNHFNNNITLWDAITGQRIRTFSSSGWVYSIAFSPDGKYLLSCFGGNNFYQTESNDIRLWDITTGHEIRAFLGYETNFKSVAFNSDGRQFITGSFDGLVKLWDTATFENIRSFTGHLSSVNTVVFSPDGRQIISGSDDNTIKLWDVASGREVRTFNGHSSSVNSISFIDDGRKILSGSSDGTTRLWDIATGREIAQFISFTDGEWIVITPDGYYNASPNGDKYLNVRVGNNVYGIDQYRHTFYRPQIVEARLQGRQDPVQVTATIQQAVEPPVVTIRSPQNNSRINASQVELSVLIESNQPIRNMRILVNGRLVGGNEMRGGIRGVRSGDLEATGIFLSQPQNRLEFTINLNLDPGNNHIEVIANNPHEGRARVEVFRQQTVAQQTLPNLWILSIGVNRYDTPHLDNLMYAANDAREIVRVFKAQEGKVFNRVNSMLIADGEALLPTKENIIDGFDYLKRANPNDVILLFLAGHGLNDEYGNFFFMPSDAVITNENTIRSVNAISFREIQSVLDVPGQKIVFIDACHSAGAGSRMTRMVDNNRLVRDLMIQSQSTVIFTSSRSDQGSIESSDLRHGIFTYSILQGMGGAAYSENGVITMRSLERYVNQRVLELTEGLQHPFTETPDGFTDFIIARTR